MTVFPIAALKDNYIWCIQMGHDALVVDPGDDLPVKQQLTEQALNLKAILLTHHHYDHTQGVASLLKIYDVPVYGPQAITQVTNPILSNRLELDSLALTFDVLAVPGHTLEHVAYYTKGHVFTGDTLFMAGCGRIFEGTVSQMYTSLTCLKKLPDDTLIYCGHEYTESNLRFAATVEPNNPDIIARLKKTITLRQKNCVTVPAPLYLEKKTNPFLRCEHPAVRTAAEQHTGHSLNDPIEVFAAIRAWKNSM